MFLHTLFLIQNVKQMFGTCFLRAACVLMYILHIKPGKLCEIHTGTCVNVRSN